MFAYTPGERSSEIVAGISYGARVLAWAGIIALLIWFLFH
jgi:hypothetical protein